MNIHAETNGQAMTEFIIVFPVLFLLFLVIIQTTLLMTARQVVEYSAFYATRSASVNDPYEAMAKRAADIACISIVPPMTAETFTALHEFADGLGDTVIDAAVLAEEYPEYPDLGTLDLRWDTIPGMEIIEKLRNSNYNDILPDRDSNLTEGLSIIADMSGEGESVLLRYAGAKLLNVYDISTSSIPTSSSVLDVSVEITHNYILRVPIVNKLFFYMYIHGYLRGQIRDKLLSLPQNIPQEAINEITSTALNSVTSLINASPYGSLYFTPIKADSTFTIEADAETRQNCL